MSQNEVIGSKLRITLPENSGVLCPGNCNSVYVNSVLLKHRLNKELIDMAIILALQSISAVKFNAVFQQYHSFLCLIPGIKSTIKEWLSTNHLKLTTKYVLYCLQCNIFTSTFEYYVTLWRRLTISDGQIIVNFLFFTKLCLFVSKCFI